MLCGAIIENVLQDSEESIAVAYFFCDYKSRETQQIEVILGSLAAQIALQNPRAFEQLEEYYDELHQKGDLENPVETDRLIAVIQEMASQFGKLYIVVDALDECGVETYNIAEALKELVDGAKSINLAVCSREEEDIREVLADDFGRIEIEAHTEDLELYVGAEMSQRKNLKDLYIKNPQLNADIRYSLISRAQGM